jgi:hypothetical protein
VQLDAFAQRGCACHCQGLLLAAQGLSSALQASSTSSTCECVKRVRFHVRLETTSPHCTTDEPPSATTKAAKNVFDAAAAMASAASLADWTA